jgi:hypothetical protein
MVFWGATVTVSESSSGISVKRDIQ